MTKPSSIFSRAVGFTLVELLIVVTIIGMAAALVGPNLFGAYEGAQRRVELRSAKDLFKQLSYKAFVNERAISVRLAGNTIRYWYRDERTRDGEKHFEHLTFAKQMFHFTAAGQADRETVTVIDNQQQVNVTLNWGSQ